MKSVSIRQIRIRPQRQSGAALMVSLLLIFAMSMLGISAMRSGSLNNRMVTNAIEKDLSRQVAESASDLAMSDNLTLANVICNPEVVNVPVNELQQPEVVTASAGVAYQGESVALGFSRGSGFTAMHFESTATATLVASGTDTQISQGVYIIGPEGSSGGC